MASLLTKAGTAMRYRITIRGDAPRTELRGYADLSAIELVAFADAMRPFGLVIVSYADDDYDPFEDKS
jgi:hypothetical protein